ncbi:hypothetical protein NB689_002349 [Xanthomonas sacchari]|nr:hypothetical protein [Xanthomonas sacchari]
MRGGQGVAVVDHAPVVAGEGRFVHAVADLAGVVALGHLLLCVEYRAQLLLHALQRSQQLPQFVVARVLDAAVQAAGGDRAGDFHRTGQRLDHQPPQQQVEAAAEQQRGAQADRHDGPQQAARLRHQHRLRHRHAQREALLGLADLQRHIHFHVGGAGLRIDGVAVDGLALGDLGQQGAGGRILQLLADQCRIAVGDDDAARREQADVAGTERAQLGDALLQRGQAEIGGDHTQELAVFQDRCADRGHQHLLAGDLVIVGFGDGRPQQLARIQIPVAGAGHVVVAQRIAHEFPVLPGPVHHVAAAGVVARAVGIVRVLAVQRLRFPQRAHAGPVRMLLQFAAQAVAEQLARLVLAALGEQRIGQRLVGDRGGADGVADALRFQARGVGHAELGRGKQGGTAAGVDDGGGNAEAQQRDRGHAEHQAGGDTARACGGRRGHRGRLDGEKGEIALSWTGVCCLRAQQAGAETCATLRLSARRPRNVGRVCGAPPHAPRHRPCGRNWMLCRSSVAPACRGACADYPRNPQRVAASGTMAAVVRAVRRCARRAVALR